MNISHCFCVCTCAAICVLGPLELHKKQHALICTLPHVRRLQEGGEGRILFSHGGERGATSGECRSCVHAQQHAQLPNGTSCSERRRQPAQFHLVRPRQVSVIFAQPPVVHGVAFCTLSLASMLLRLALMLMHMHTNRSAAIPEPPPRIVKVRKRASLIELNAASCLQRSLQAEEQAKRYAHDQFRAKKAEQLALLLKRKKSRMNVGRFCGIFSLSPTLSHIHLSTSLAYLLHLSCTAHLSFSQIISPCFSLFSAQLEVVSGIRPVEHSFEDLPLLNFVRKAPPPAPDYAARDAVAISQIRAKLEKSYGDAQDKEAAMREHRKMRMGKLRQTRLENGLVSHLAFASVMTRYLTRVCACRASIILTALTFNFSSLSFLHSSAEGSCRRTVLLSVSRRLYTGCV